jgi:hypothetical protein
MTADTNAKLPLEFYVLSGDTKHGILRSIKAIFPAPGWEVDPVTGEVLPPKLTKGDKGDQGPPGKSAYEIAVAAGFVGTETQWLESLKGKDGKNGLNGMSGTDGKSAYELAVAAGFTGTEAQWLASLKGADGKDGKDGTLADGMVCYAKNNLTFTFATQSGFPVRRALDGSGALAEQVHGQVYRTDREEDGQYMLRDGANNRTGSTGGFAVAFNFAIGRPLPEKFYSQKLLGTPGTTYKVGYWARERAANPAGRFRVDVKDGATTIATGDSGPLATTYTNYASGEFVMPASGEVTMELFSLVAGSGSGNDPLLDDIGLWTGSGAVIKYTKITQNGVITYYDAAGAPITGAALTALLADIASLAAKVTCCTCP